MAACHVGRAPLYRHFYIKLKAKDAIINGVSNAFKKGLESSEQKI